MAIRTFMGCRFAYGCRQILGAYLGSKLILKTNGKFIKTLFLIVVGATIIKVAWDYFT